MSRSHEFGLVDAGTLWRIVQLKLRSDLNIQNESQS
jgi:hypothetical protein